MILLLNRATITIEGNIPVEQMLKAYDALPLDKIMDMAAASGN